MSWALARGAAAAAALVTLTLAPAAQAQVEPYGTDNYGAFYNILPPGTNGLVNALDLASYELTGTKPAHNDDQLAMYANLTTAAPNIQASQLTQYFKDATFGVPAGDVASSESPEPGVTIERDSQFGVPHIYGDTRAELMFGIGYATAEDRLFFIDAIRHLGRGDLAGFAGGANAPLDELQWEVAPYTEQDLQDQVNYAAATLPDGQQILADANNYVDGINGYIAHAQLDPLAMPAEYLALGDLGGPAPFDVEDLVAIASLVGGQLGVGGGDQLANAVLYGAMKARFGAERRSVAGSPELVKPAPPAKRRRRGRQGRRGRVRTAKPAPDHSGFATFLSFVDPSDPEAPTTVRGRSFPYQTLPLPSRTNRASIALPDPGSVQFVSPIVSGALPPGAPGGFSRRAGRIGLALGSAANDGPGLVSFPHTDSNALLVSGAHTASGHPIAVMGPQTSYFSPQALMEEDIHGPGIDADGAAFAGINLYVEFGHGPDYAWSATSAGQNVIDTFAVPLCDPSGGTPTLDSDYYELGGQCVAMQTLTRTESWTPNLADSTPAGSVTFQTERTAFGLVIARATIRGRPVAYTNLRSTYMHELDSAQGLEMFNEPAQMETPQAFMNSADHVGYTFNWFYVNPQHIAYFNSGDNPVRAPRTDPLFPTWSSFPWQDWSASNHTEALTRESAHPQAVDQPYLTSWNNKQAPGYNDAATGQQYSSVYRSQLLDSNIEYYLNRAGGKMSLVDLVNAMGNAGTQDLRGVAVLPYALRIIGQPTDPALAQAVDELSAWVDSGAHRINRERPGASGEYDQSDAVTIMDAWWPLLVQAEFGPVLGPQLLAQVGSDFPINDEPGHGTSGPHVGSAFDVGFYGIVQKDLRAVLGERVAGPLNRVYCGQGSLARCRAALESSLSQAIAQTPAQVYRADGVCAAGDQMCSDSIQFRAIGAVAQPLIEWVNRSTFQQAVEIQGP